MGYHPYLRSGLALVSIFNSILPMKLGCRSGGWWPNPTGCALLMRLRLPLGLALPLPDVAAAFRDSELARCSRVGFSLISAIVMREDLAA
jgi:hypothetical protein